jgi:hypothetical protein
LQTSGVHFCEPCDAYFENPSSHRSTKRHKTICGDGTTVAFVEWFCFLLHHPLSLFVLEFCCCAAQGLRAQERVHVPVGPAAAVGPYPDRERHCKVSCCGEYRTGILCPRNTVCEIALSADVSCAAFRFAGHYLLTSAQPDVRLLIFICVTTSLHHACWLRGYGYAAVARGGRLGGRSLRFWRWRRVQRRAIIFENHGRQKSIFSCVLDRMAPVFDRRRRPPPRSCVTVDLLAPICETAVISDRPLSLPQCMPKNARGSHYVSTQIRVP